MIIRIPIAHLRAAVMIAAKQDIRYYLNGVYVETGQGGTRLTATDGLMLLCIKSDRSPLSPSAFILPRTVVEAFKPSAADLRSVDTFLELHMATVPGVKCRAVWRDTQIEFESVDGRYPDYRRVVPKFEGDGELNRTQHDAEQLATMVKAGAMAARQRKVTMHLQGAPGSPSRVVFIGWPDMVGMITEVHTLHKGAAKVAPTLPDVSWISDQA